MQQTATSLSPAQERFAHEHHATVGLEACIGTGVFFYEKHTAEVLRWLVDQRGSVLEEARFHRRAA